MRDVGEFGEHSPKKTRVVAQLGSAFDWGSKGRGFKSRQPDYQQKRRLDLRFLFLNFEYRMAVMRRSIKNFLLW